MPQHSVLRDGKETKRTLPYNRQYVILAIYEVLDKNGAGYEKTDASTVISNMSVYGNLSRFSICVTEQEHGTELSVTVRGAFCIRCAAGHNSRCRQHLAVSGK